MSFRVENRPVSRREFYSALVGILGFVGLVAITDQADSSRTLLLGVILLTMLWALIELLRTQRTN
jgi:hypothetical protein